MDGASCSSKLAPSPLPVSEGNELVPMQHCIQLTREQYSAMCELQHDPLFKKALLPPASYPSWERLISGKRPRRRVFTWIIYHYWLGSLKFALQSKCVKDWGKLYEDIFSIYEDLVSEIDNDSFVFCPPRKRRLIFDHVERGIFRLKLSVYDTGESRPQGVGTSRTEEECRRHVRVLSSEAVHLTRGSPWPKACRNLYDHVAGLPHSVLDADGVEFGHKRLDQASIGPESAAYRHELRRSVAYIAEQMELRGDRVDWDALYVGAISPDKNRPHSLLSAISASIDGFIKHRGRELL